MRIAHVTDYYLPRLGGIEMQVHDLASRQRAEGHDPTVITPTPESLGSDTSDPDPRWVERVDTVTTQRAIRPFMAGFSASDLLTRERFDMVHVHASLISPFAMLAARAASHAGLPTVVTVHSLWARTGPAPDIAWGIVGHKQWPVIWSAVSRTAAGQVSKTLRGAAVAVLPNGIDADAWRTIAAPKEPSTVTIASVMRLSRRKRPMPLLRMLRRLRLRVSPSIRLHAVLIGDGPLLERMAGYLKAHDMDGWVSLPGRLERPDIRQIFSLSDLYVAPAELESFGIAALEARCVGLPVVAKANSGVSEFIRHEREGLLCGSDEDMADAVVRLVRDHELRLRIAAHNRTADSPVGWETLLQKTEAAYASACLAQAAGAQTESRRVPERQRS